MSYGILRQNGQDTYNLKEFIVDTYDEITKFKVLGNVIQIKTGDTLNAEILYLQSLGIVDQMQL